MTHQNGISINSIIANNGSATGLTKSGLGSLTLGNGGNTYTGPTTVNSGTLFLSSSAGIAGTSSVSLSSGAFISFARNANESTVIGSTTVISGAGGVIENLNNPNQSSSLDRPNTYTGPTQIVIRGGFTAGVASTYDGSGNQTSGAFGVNSAIQFSNNGSELLFLNGFNNQVGSLSGAQGSVVLGSTVARGSATLTIGGDNTSTSFSGIISDANTSGNGAGGGAVSTGGSLIKIGTGTQTLAGADAYSGGTTVKAGTLTSAVANGFGTGNVTVNPTGTAGTAADAATLNSTGSIASTAAVTVNSSSATAIGRLNFNGATPTIGSLAGTGAGIVALNNSTGTALTLGNATNTSFSGSITGALGSLTKVGTGNQTLAGSNTYTGFTNVSNGTLSVTGSLASTSVVTVGNTTTASLTPTLAGSGTVGAVTLLNANGGVGSAGQLTPSATTLTLGSLNAQSGSTINLGTISPTLPAFNVSGAVNLLSDGGSTPINLTGTFGTLATGSYPLFNYGSLTVNGTATGTLTPDFSTLTVASGDSYSITDASNLVSLNIISAGPVTLTYLNQNGQFDTGSSPSFNGSSGPTTFQAGNNVLFDDSFSGPYTVPVSGAVSPGSTTFNNSGGNYVVSGVTSTSGITGSGSLTVNAGATKSVTLFTSNNYSGGTFVNTGTLILASANALPTNSALNISGGAIVQVANHTTNANFVPTVSVLSNNGTIDLTNNALVIHNLNTSSGNVNGTTAAAVIFTQIQNAYNNGAWNGTNASSGVITSTQAANDSTHLTAVGYVTGYTGSFENVSGGVTASDVLVKYTYYGDATLDGTVDGSDYSRIDNGYLAGASGWFNGDFNYDGHIDGSDYTLIDNAFNTQGANIASEIANPSAVATAQIAGSGAGTSAVPEPTTLGLLGLGAIGLLGRRRRKSSLKA